MCSNLSTKLYRTYGSITAASLVKKVCTSPVQGEINPVEPNNNQRYSKRVCFIAKKELPRAMAALTYIE
jgi:hypothetical protein